MFQAESCPKVTLYLSKVHALILKQFQYPILKILGLKIFVCVSHDLITDILIASGNPSIWMDQTGLPGA